MRGHKVDIDYEKQKFDYVKDSRLTVIGVNCSIVFNRKYVIILIT